MVGAAEAHAAGFVHAVAAADEAEAEAIALARTLAAHPPDGMRVLRGMFRELEATTGRVAHENALLLDFQQRGPGLPRRP